MTIVTFICELCFVTRPDNNTHSWYCGCVSRGPAKFDLQPNLYGQILDLRPLVASDFEKLYLKASDPLVWEQHPTFNRYQIEVFTEFFNGALESKGAFAIIEREKGEVIGTSRYYDFQPENRQVSIGFTFLGRHYWGGKFNGELKSLMLHHAFQFVDTIIFEVGERNHRSRRAVEKLGAKLFDRRDLDGQAHVAYRLLKPA